MDKKKVKELIKQAIGVNLNNLVTGDNEHNAPTNKANALLSEAIRELSKPDWISVEDGLPEYYEKVLVCNKEAPKSIYMTNRTDQSEIYEGVDANGFYLGYKSKPVTHWKPIEKLEE